MGWGLAGGLALGALSAGASLISQNKQAAAQRAAQQQAQQQIQQQNNAAIAAQQQADFQRQQMDIQASTERAKQKALTDATIGPAGDRTPKPLATIATSPLGDTSDPYTGRTKLLGN